MQREEMYELQVDGVDSQGLARPPQDYTSFVDRQDDLATFATGGGVPDPDQVAGAATSEGTVKHSVVEIQGADYASEAATAEAAAGRAPAEIIPAQPAEPPAEVDVSAQPVVWDEPHPVVTGTWGAPMPVEVSNRGTSPLANMLEGTVGQFEDDPQAGMRWLVGELRNAPATAQQFGGDWFSFASVEKAQENLVQAVQQVIALDDAEALAVAMNCRQQSSFFGAMVDRFLAQGQESARRVREKLAEVMEVYRDKVQVHADVVPTLMMEAQAWRHLGGEVTEMWDEAASLRAVPRWTGTAASEYAGAVEVQMLALQDLGGVTHQAFRSCDSGAEKNAQILFNVELALTEAEKYIISVAPDLREYYTRSAAAELTLQHLLSNVDEICHGKGAQDIAQQLSEEGKKSLSSGVVLVGDDWPTGKGKSPAPNAASSDARAPEKDPGDNSGHKNADNAKQPTLSQKDPAAGMWAGKSAEQGGADHSGDGGTDTKDATGTAKGGSDKTAGDGAADGKDTTATQKSGESHKGTGDESGDTKGSLGATESGASHKGSSDGAGNAKDATGTAKSDGSELGSLAAGADPQTGGDAVAGTEADPKGSQGSGGVADAGSGTDAGRTGDDANPPAGNAGQPAPDPGASTPAKSSSEVPPARG